MSMSQPSSALSSHMSAHLNLTQNIVESLGSSIVAKQSLSTTSKITEKRVCTDFGASRSIVREALTILSSKGLIRSNMSQGTRVCKEQEWNLLDKDIVRWMAQGSLSEKLLVEISQVRKAVEPMGAFIAAKRQTEEQGSVLRSVSAELCDARIDMAAFLGAKIKFHQMLLLASGNKAIQQFQHLVELGIRADHESNLHPQDSFDAYLNAHLSVMNNICANNPLRAKLCMQELLQCA